ncbi:MAG: ABC transporter ATP-binding protein [Myxococcota bacterium]
MSRLRVTELSAKRGGATVLQDVNLTAHDGEVLAIAGPNGAGKSTLFECLTMSVPFTGEAQIMGAALGDLNALERARALAYVPQRSALRAALPVEHVVAMGRFAHGNGLFGASSKDTAVVEDVLRTLDLVSLRRRPFPSLSLGQQQRVLIGRALATGAPLLLLDEPTAALDLRQRLLAMERLQAIALSGRAVVVVLHDLDDVHRYADRVVVLDEGRVVTTGAPADALSDDVMARVYGVRRTGDGFELANDPSGAKESP